MGGWPFVGRREELALITRAMADPRVGGLVLSGAAGVGKTRLALESLAATGRDGATRWTAATKAVRPVPLGVFAPLFPAPLPATSNQVDLLRLAGDLLLAAGGERRLVLGIDDAHLLDGLSAALLQQLLPTAAVFALVVVRSGEPTPEPISSLWRHPLVDRMERPDLSRPHLEQMLAEHLGGEVDGRTVERLWRVSAGNPLILRELAGAGAQTGALRLVEGLWRWHGPWVLAPRLIELVEHRLSEVDAAEREVLELLAYAGPIGPDLLAGLVSAEAVEGVEEKSLCRVEQHDRRLVAQLAHPLYGMVLRARTPVLRARRRQRQLADALAQTGARRAGDCLRLAAWRLASGEMSPARELAAAARDAWAALDLDQAERLARAASRAGAKLAAGDVLWRVLGLQGRVEELEELLAGLHDGPGDDADRARLACARACNLYWGLDRVDEAVALVDEVAQRLTDRPALLELAALRAVLLVHAGKFGRAAPAADELLGRPDLGGTARAHAHLAKGIVLLVQGRAGPAIDHLEQSVTSSGWPTPMPWLGELAALWRCQAYLIEGRLAAAAAVAEASYRRAVPSGWDLALGAACIALAQVCRARGQLRRSLRWSREGLGVIAPERLGGYVLRGLLLAELAVTTAQLGEHLAADRALRDSEQDLRPGLAICRLWTDLATVWVTAARGDPTAASRQALAVAAAARDLGSPAYEAIALHEACRLGAAVKVAKRLDALATSTSNVAVRSYAAYAAALAQHDGPTLDRVSAELEGMGALLMAAEVAVQAVPAHRRAGRRDSARRAATRAATLAATCEGATTPALQGLRTPGLTRRQWQIVRLAADGFTNEQIADRLVVSIRTVHNHLHQAYLRLGVHNRAELPSVVDFPGGTERPAVH